jgi:hypothetical protein
LPATYGLFFPLPIKMYIQEDLMMRRMATYLLAIFFAALACAAAANAQTGAAGCSRTDLNDITEKYFASLQEHKTSALPLASTVKFTENGVEKAVGKGFWETAGKPLLKRTLIDTQKCGIGAIAVIEEKYTKPAGSSPAGGMGGYGGGAPGGGGMGGPGAKPQPFGGGGGPMQAVAGGGAGGGGGFGGGAPGGGGFGGGAPGGGGFGGGGFGGGAPGGGGFGGGGAPGGGGMFGSAKPAPAEGTVRPILFGARLKVAAGKITEIETVIARENEFAFNADGVLKTKDQDWETILTPDQRTSRKVMIEAADNYFNMFAADPKVSVPFAKVCDRWENGTQTTAGNHDCSPKGLTITNHGPRRFLVDTEKGIVIAYVLFAGGLPDCHMFRMRDGKVDLAQAIVGAGSQSMGWPNEPAE